MSNVLHVLFGLSATLHPRHFEIRAMFILGYTSIFLYHSLLLLVELCHSECMEDYRVSSLSQNWQILNKISSFRLRKWEVNEFRWYLLNHIYAWTIPCVMTITVYTKHYFKPSLGVTTCWFHRMQIYIKKILTSFNGFLFLENHDQWTLVYMPISLMLSLNVVFCAWSSMCLTKSDYTPDTLKALRYK